MHTSIGIDIGGTRVKAAAIDQSGTIIERIMEPSEVSKQYEKVLQQIVRIVRSLEKSTDLHADTIGLAVAGLMNKDCTIVLESPNCPALPSRNLVEDVCRLTDKIVVMDNDANLMAVGEGAFGAARDSRYFIALTLGTGIGGAVVVDGKVLKGVNGGGGELGHIIIDRTGPQCSCGSYGCLEAFIGQAGIRRFIDSNVPHFSTIGLKDINELANQGNEHAISVFRYVGEVLGIAMAGLVNVFNPELIVIGGGVAAAGDLVLSHMSTELRRRAFESYTKNLHIRPAELGNWAGVVGAAKLALDRLQVNLH